MNWRKSSYSFSNGNCAEVASWRTPLRSAYNGSCVEVGHGAAIVGVRDSRDPAGPVLTFGGGAWTAFTAQLRAGPVLDRGGCTLIPCGTT